MTTLDDIEEELEELRDEIESIKEDSDSEEEDSEDEDEPRTLYIYIQYVSETEEILGMEMEKREVLLLEENNSYQVPNETEAKFASTTRQVIQYIQNLGIDCWENIKRKAERESAVYYTVFIPSYMASEVEEGAWVEKAEASKLIDEMEPREYL
jgi:hypothetical protein